MDRTDTQNFTNVDSFSQLPFIRPATKEKGIRLFGIEFGDAPVAAGESKSTEKTTTCNAFKLDGDNNKDNNNTENSRRFECHYCCRNFPTSQALGGHQNAHKRERQQAKRPYLHPAMVHSSFYGLMNYRFGSPPSTAMMSYPTWNSNTNPSSAMISGGGGRFYRSSYSHHNSPLALRRVPTATSHDVVQNNPIFNHQSLLHPLPLFSSEEMNMRMGPLRASPSGSQNLYVYDSKPSVNDHVSLDLHL